MHPATVLMIRPKLGQVALLIRLRPGPFLDLQSRPHYSNEGCRPASERGSIDRLTREWVAMREAGTALLTYLALIGAAGWFSVFFAPPSRNIDPSG